MTLDDIKEVFEQNETFAVFAHENPDGDAIGSALAVRNVLVNLGKHADVILDGCPANFDYLEGFNDIITESKIDYDVAIAVDCPDIKRIKTDFVPYFEKAKIKIEFDHHTNNTRFADHCIVDQACPACCQILASSFNYMQYEITKPIAECLLTGIITDTGGFRHEGTNEETFEFAGWCANKGLNITKIYRESMTTITKTKFEHEKLAMKRMQFLADGKVAFTYTLKEDDDKIGYEPGDHDGIVEIGRTIKGVEVSIYIYQREDGDFKASLRSNEYVDVSEICLLFGGGGHVRAAGTNLKMKFEDAKNSIINETMKHV